MKQILYAGLLLLALNSCKEQPRETEWITLFNGTNLEGWTPKFYHHETGDNYADTFRVEDSSIVVAYDKYDSFNERYGHLFYEKAFESFHLKFKYRFTDEWMEDAPSYTFRNSGVMFHSQAPETILKEQDWPLSVEYQMLAEAEPGKPRPTGNMCSPGTDVYYEGKKSNDHCINSTSETYTWDTWVEADLIVYSDSLIIHKVNGKEVLRYSQTQLGGEVANGFDPALKIDGTALKSGYIGLQAEGQGVIFKDLKLKEL
ncbi:3-keto-disaccharide hydrolase [Leeuwenhoekiella sp. H156]|uniref:3-keto-disaccharide hydrolase n=1 Tax=Leeuwenhoekiella sp. H156 TaxID=3450128 RepID=UPI003FA4BDB2